MRNAPSPGAGKLELAKIIRAMRIAFVGPARSLHFQRWVDWFRRNGHTTIVVSDSEAEEWSHDVIVIPSFGRIVRGRWWRYGYEIENFRKARWLKKLLIDEDVQILQAHMLLYPGFLGLQSGFRPFAIHFYNGDILWKANTSLRHKIRTLWALRRAELISGFSQAQVERCLRLGSKPGRTHQIMMGVDLRRFGAPGDVAALRKGLGIETENVVFSPRGISRPYNIEGIVRAAASVVRRVPDSLFIFGFLEEQEQPDYLDHVNRSVAELSLEPNVRIVRGIPYHEMPKYYACARVTVSVAIHDNLPFSVMEAMASGSACVVSDIASIDELVRHEREGLRVEAGNPEQVADAIIRLLEDEELRRALVTRAQARARERCDFEMWMRKAETYYSQLVERQTRQGER